MSKFKAVAAKLKSLLKKLRDAIRFMYKIPFVGKFLYWVTACIGEIGLMVSGMITVVEAYHIVDGMLHGFRRAANESAWDVAGPHVKKLFIAIIIALMSLKVMITTEKDWSAANKNALVRTITM